MNGITYQKNLIPQDLGITTHIVPNADNSSHKHYHYEIFYILDGSVYHTLNGKKKLLTLGDCCFMSREDSHKFTQINHSLQRDLLITPTLFDSIYRIISQQNDSIVNILSDDTRIIHFSIPELTELENLANQFTNATDILKKRGLGIELLVKIINKYINSTTETVKAQPALISNILNLLNKSNGVKGGIPVIVSDIKYSKSYICYAFKNYMGITLSQYIKNLRIKYIEYYLTTTNYSLQQIADAVGIDSLSYLNKIFKEKHSMSPIRYRRNYKFIETAPPTISR